GVAAKANVGLLADRHETGVAREEIPHLGQHQERDELHDRAHEAGVAAPRHEDEADYDEDGADAADPARRRGALHLESGRGAQSTRRDRAKSPDGRRSSTARKTR